MSRRFMCGKCTLSDSRFSNCAEYLLAALHEKNPSSTPDKPLPSETISCIETIKETISSEMYRVVNGIQSSITPLIESLTSNNNKVLDHINIIEDKLTVTNTNVAYLMQNLNSNDRLKDIHTKLSEIRSENLTDSGHMTKLKTEVDDCRKIIKFLETEIGYKNVIISKLLENNNQLTTSCSNSEKKLTTLNEEMESIKTQLLNMSAKPKRSNETNSEDESD